MGRRGIHAPALSRRSSGQMDLRRRIQARGWDHECHLGQFLFADQLLGRACTNHDALNDTMPVPLNQSCQPTPGARFAVVRVLLARHGCTLCSAYTMHTSVGRNYLMKNIIALVIAVSALALVPGCAPPQAKAWKQTYSSFDLPSDHPAEGIASRISYNSQGRSAGGGNATL